MISSIITRLYIHRYTHNKMSFHKKLTGNNVNFIVQLYLVKIYLLNYLGKFKHS